MKNLNWGLLLFVLLVIVLMNPFKANLREYHGGGGGGHGGGHGGHGGYGGRGRGGGYGYYGGVGGWGGSNPLYYGYDEDYYYVLPRYFPFPLGYS